MTIILLIIIRSCQVSKRHLKASGSTVFVIMSSDKEIVRNCEVITKFDTGSDHRMSDQE